MTSSSASDEGKTEPRLDPRADRSRGVALEAARSLLIEEGWDAVTQAGVAARSKLNRATVYRHWPKSADLLRDVLQAEIRPVEVAAERTDGDLRTDLILIVAALHDEMTRGLGRVLAALVDRAEWDDDLMRIKREVIRIGTTGLRDRLRIAVASGAVGAGLDIEEAITRLVGSLIYRRLIASERVTRQWIERLVDDVLAVHHGAATT